MSLAAVFSPTPGTPGQVVGRVAPQGRVLRVERGGHAGALGDAGLVVERVVGHAPLVVEHLDVGVLDELVAVAVAGDDDDVVARVAALGGEGGDDVVRLEARRPRRSGSPATRRPGGRGPSAGAGCPGRRRGCPCRCRCARGGRSARGGRAPRRCASGWWSRSRLTSIEVNPNTALVTCPDAVARSVGSAKKAR